VLIERPAPPDDVGDGPAHRQRDLPLLGDEHLATDDERLV
jgi:hypothetical protein